MTRWEKTKFKPKSIDKLIPVFTMDVVSPF